MKDVVVSLIQSRKFWLTLLTVGSSCAMYFRHGISSEQLANVLTASSAVLVFAIAHEDRGAPQSIATTGDVTVQPTVKK